ncbi:amino acid transport protein [Acinetobacter seifertii]|uniref:amino acid transport protein n=1 Tax=Acinetobacter seifertii TaxID=1530123 RepID=UPI000839DCE8|nr:amino acid transport protein [Acinetobacter seifertii]OCZ51036.1 amino acid transport protein [Acinetobacter seifertii]
MNSTRLFLSVIFSSIGLGYFLYGKKQKMTVPFTVDLVLMIFPYFIESNVLLSGIGTLLSVIPYFLRF